MLSKLKGWYQQLVVKKPAPVVSEQPACTHSIVKEFSEIYSLFEKINADSSTYKSLFNPMLVTTNTTSCFRNVEDLIQAIVELRLKIALMDISGEESQYENTPVKTVPIRHIALAKFNVTETYKEITIRRVVLSIREELRLLLNELSIIVESRDTNDYLTLLSRQNTFIVQDLISYVEAIEQL